MKDPTPKRTHDLRTRIRRSETVVRAMSLEGTRKGKRVLKAVKPLYK